MKIEIKIDESCTEPKIVIVTDRVTDKINEIIKKLSVEPSEVLAGFRDEPAAVRGGATSCKLILRAHIKQRDY